MKVKSLIIAINHSIKDRELHITIADNGIGIPAEIAREGVSYISEGPYC